MHGLKKLGDKGWAVLDVVGRQTNKIANKLGTESFWPMPLDKECDKAAAILRTFTREGFHVKSDTPSSSKNNTTKSMFKVPPQVLQQAKGIVIFTVFRTGFQVSGAGGSGILLARQPDGTFGPPSGILLHTLGVGFLIGLDVYDTLIILRTQEAVNAFAHPKISIGAELSVAAGPIGSGRALDMGFTDRAPAWVYTKSKGFYAGIALDGTVVIERNDENERFYGRKVKAAELIKGEVDRPLRSMAVDRLIAAIEMAEGKYRHLPPGHGPGPRHVENVVTEEGDRSTPEPPFDHESKYQQVPPLPARRRLDERMKMALSDSDPPFRSGAAVASSSSTPPLPARRSRGGLDEKEKASSDDNLDGYLQDVSAEPSYQDAPPPQYDTDENDRQPLEKSHAQ